MVKYYSDVLKKVYDTEEELKKEEKEYEIKLAEEKKAAEELKTKRDEKAKQVQIAEDLAKAKIKEAKEAEDNYKKLLTEFINEFGQYRTVIKDYDTLYDPFDLINKVENAFKTIKPFFFE